MMIGKRIFPMVAAVALAVPATPALAQFESGPDALVKAVRTEDFAKASELVTTHGPSIINARDAKGETALIVAVTRREPEWTGYLLRQGADPNYAARNGDTPLIAAARAGFLDAVRWLLGLGAKVNDSNRMGETPLIVAVQSRQIPVVRYLLEKGADPDDTDSAAGYSARDYAKRDNRGGEMLRLIEAQKKAKPASPPGG